MSNFNENNYYVVRVRYKEGYNKQKLYSFAIHKDDVVKLSEYSTPVGITNLNGVVDIVEILSFKEAKEKGWTVPTCELKGVFDETPYLNRKSNREMKKKLRKKMDQRIEELKTIEVYNLFAEKDDELKQILKEYNEIEV